MAKIIKSISVMVFGSVVWMFFTIALPMHQMQDLTVGFVIGQAYADDSHDSEADDSNDSEADDSHDSEADDSHDSEAADSNDSEAADSNDSDDIDFSSATLVCISSSVVLTTFVNDDDLTTTVQSLPGCTVFGAPTAAGVWVPFVAINSTTSGGTVSLISQTASAYFNLLASGTSGLTGTPADSMMMAYREIRGQ